jgi:solute carrier family 35 protein
MGYLAIMGNNVFTALYGGVSKSKLSGKPKDETPLTKFGLLYYNSLLSFPFMLAVVLLLEPAAFTATFTWFSMAGPWELTFFSFSLVMGVVLNYAVFLCTQLNSATTTCVTGSLKNILVAYASIFFMGNYTFDWTNFMGLNISMGGSLYYAWAKLTKK